MGESRRCCAKILLGYLSFTLIVSRSCQCLAFTTSSFVVPSSTTMRRIQINPFSNDKHLSARRRFEDDDDDDDDIIDFDDDDKREYARVRRGRGRRNRYLDDEIEFEDERKDRRYRDFDDEDYDDDIYDDDDEDENDETDDEDEFYDGIIPNPLLDQIDPDGAIERWPELARDPKFWRDAFFVLFLCYAGLVAEIDNPFTFLSADDIDYESFYR